jgi:hypothetical protein
VERTDPAKYLKTHRALYSADQRYTALPAGVTCLLPADAAGIDLRLRTFLRLGPRRFLLRHPDAAAERQPDAAAVIAIDVTNVASMVLTAAFLIFDRERDRLSGASMRQPGRPEVDTVVRESCGGTMTSIDTTSDTVTSQFVEKDINRPTGKLTDCKLHFVGCPLRVSRSSASRSGSVAVVAMSRSPHGNTFRIVVDMDPIQCTFSTC